MSVAGATAIPWRALAAYLAVLAAQRVVELSHSAHNTRALARRGAREFGTGHWPAIVALHALFPVCLVVEVLACGTRPGALRYVALGAWLAAQALRYSAVIALADRFTVGIWVLPGAALVRRGPYRFFRHPNYLAVAIEFAAAPAMFGAWRTAVGFSVLNALALQARIRAEDAALREATGGG